MKKSEFATAMRNFRLETTGAACFLDRVRNRHFCANNLTQQQAQEFARNNELTLKNWFPGASCSTVSCT